MDQYPEVIKLFIVNYNFFHIHIRILYLQVTDFCEELLNAGVTSPYLYAFLIDLYEEKCSRDYKTNVAECKDLSIRVLNLCDLLINDYDIIRCKYWEYVKDNLKHQFQQLELLAECRENSTETETTNTTEKTDDNSTT